MSRRELSHKVQHRPGEGYLLDMTVVDSDTSSQTVVVNGLSVPVPDRKYACDAAQVLFTNTGVRLLFGQCLPVGNGLLSMLVINIAAESIMQFLGSINHEFEESAKAYLKDKGGVPSLSTFQENAEQSVVLTGSFILAGYTGFASCLDIYNASPFSIQQMAAMKKLAVEPVVRVNLSTGLMLALIDALRAGASQWKWIKEANGARV